MYYGAFFVVGDGGSEPWFNESILVAPILLFMKLKHLEILFRYYEFSM